MKRVLMFMFMIFSFSFADVINDTINEELFKTIYITNANIENVMITQETIRNHYSQIYMNIKKDTNGGYIVSLPTLEYFYKQGNFIYNPEVSVNFTAKRGQGLTTLNHHSVNMNNNVGVLFDNDFFVTFSVGSTYYFAENDSNEVEGFQWYNDLRFGMYF